MRILLQRVSRAEVRILPEMPGGETRISGCIGHGYVVLVGFTHTDTDAELRWMADKIAGLRLFPDCDDKMNRDVVEQDGALLVVSQFTLYADSNKGKRPSFLSAARPELAVPLYNQFVIRLREHKLDVQTGEFGATMEVELVNDGPVTIWLERDARLPAL